MTTPQHVMHIISELGPGGVERQLVKALAAFDKDKFTQQVCCITRGGIYEEELKRNHIPYTIILRRGRYDFTIIRQMSSLLRREKIDIVHSYNFTANAWGRLAARLTGVRRIIAHERGTAWTENRIMRQVDRLLYPVTQVLLANSEASRIMLTQKIRLPADRIRVVHNGIPLPATRTASQASLRSLAGIGPDVPLAGTVGRLDTPKGHLFLLKAIPLVWQQVPEAHFVLIGSGPLLSYLETEARRLDLFARGCFKMLGFLPDPSDRFPELDLLVHPSIRESLGNVLIEASLAGLPVVASSVDGIPEVIVHEKTGLLVEGSQPVTYVPTPGASPLPEVVVDGITRRLRPPLGPDPADLSRAIVQLLRDPARRAEMGSQGRSRAAQQFSLEQYIRSVEAIYLE